MESGLPSAVGTKGHDQGSGGSRKAVCVFEIYLSSESSSLTGSSSGAVQLLKVVVLKVDYKTMFGQKLILKDESNSSR